MIDVSPLLLWPPDEALELMPVDSADSPQARRLAVLVAEAQAAGQHAAVLEWLCEAARVLLLDTHNPVARATLLQAINVAEAVALQAHRDDAALRALLLEFAELTPANEIEVGAVGLAEWALALLDGSERTATQAWQTATDLLAAIARASGDAADPTIGRCAEIAYRILFDRPARPIENDSTFD